MNCEKLPPSQQTLTQMSRRDNKRRRRDVTHLATISNRQQSESKTMRIATRISGRDTATKSVLNIYSSSSSDDDFERKRHKKSLSGHIEPPLSPCLLPKVAEDNVWSFDPADEVVEAGIVNEEMFDETPHESYLFEGVRHITPQKEYVGTNTRKWNEKYNDLLKRCRNAEQKN